MGLAFLCVGLRAVLVYWLRLRRGRRICWPLCRRGRCAPLVDCGIGPGALQIGEGWRKRTHKKDGEIPLCAGRPIRRKRMGKKKSACSVRNDGWALGGRFRENLGVRRNSFLNGVATGLPI